MNTGVNGLIFLMGSSRFQPGSDIGRTLAENYNLIEDAFGSFFEKKSASRCFQKEYQTKKCPNEIRIINLVLQDKAGEISRDWARHREKCKFCNQVFGAYQDLVENIHLSLGTVDQYLLTNIILAYLRDDPEVVIETFYKNLIAKEGRGEITFADVPRFLKGILGVRKMKSDFEEEAEKCWYGLVRKKYDIMGTTVCYMTPFDNYSPSFRMDFTDDLKRFYFLLWGGMQVKGGLRFEFDLPNKAVEFDAKCFAQTVKGKSVIKPIELPEWEATFYGIVN